MGSQDEYGERYARAVGRMQYAAGLRDMCVWVMDSFRDVLPRAAYARINSQRQAAVIARAKWGDIAESIEKTAEAERLVRKLEAQDVPGQRFFPFYENPGQAGVFKINWENARKL